MATKSKTRKATKAARSRKANKPEKKTETTLLSNAEYQALERRAVGNE